MKLLSKQRGLVPLVLMVFVGIASYVGGVVTVKAVNNSQAQKADYQKCDTIINSNGSVTCKEDK